MYSYYKYTDIDASTILYELDQIHYCLRAIYITPSIILNTAFINEQSNFFLPEGCFEEHLEELSLITKEEFLSFWSISTSQYLDAWNRLKTKFQINQCIDSEIVCFYPQGVIVQYSEIFFGLVNYKDCEFILGSENMYPQQKIKLYVQNFDDQNLWINFSINAQDQHV
ncbi:hypothetical protein NDN11_03970 [Acinetobacter sp. C26M]|uniref:hypothetical protein n=1 Tax=unclassified Acinetobacter TaxID=196816 RepID=UPI002036955D|nr:MULTISPECIES: hypothetical protein [unclassified Acinetobacter]USA47289.1 hypothetical protein NDN11_03970 [Acinetobacter sp. C26M]USA50770.1 hypothetical protein NDN12_03970 [Acinetobacter sp. C26G]